jgi:apolipoprotein N-acyltransferase
MNRLADSIILLWGWRRFLLAFLAGATTVLALPPFNASPVAWLTIPILIWMIDGSAMSGKSGFLRRMRPAFAVGWWFGFGYFFAGLWWFGSSFLVEADVFGWMMPFAVLALTAGLALLWGAGVAVARLFWTDGWVRVLVLAVVMTAVEWIRGHALTGFPWNAFGYTLMPDPVLMQSASVIGMWGVTLLAFLVFGAPVLLIGGSETGRGRRLTFVLIILALAADLGFGFLRLGGAEDNVVAGVRLRIVQANIAEEIKQDPEADEASFQRHIDLSRSSPQPGQGNGPNLIIWPETAVPYLLTEEPARLAQLADMLPPNVTLVTGALRRQSGGDGIANSVLVISDQGVITDSYDKVHLVPFGEYLPFGDFLEGLGIRQLITLPGGFAAGLERRTLVAGNAPPFSPFVCYEAIFPGEVTEPGVRPGWLLNVTNDGWYGDTPGPKQHFQQAVLRAVELGLPLVRAANTGISAIVDAYGRTAARLNIGESGVIDGNLPAALPPTIYARAGDLVPAGLTLVLAIVAIIGRLFAARRYN